MKRGCNMSTSELKQPLGLEPTRMATRFGQLVAVALRPAHLFAVFATASLPIALLMPFFALQPSPSST